MSFLFRPGLFRAPLAVNGIWMSAMVACSGGSSATETAPPKCLVHAADAACTNVLYGLHGGKIAPTFDEIFTRTLHPTCAVAKCHTGSTPEGSLSFDDETAAYDALLAQDAAGNGPRMTPGNLECGALLVRLETPGESWSMPFGSHLDDRTLCVIRHWIADGAPR